METIRRPGLYNMVWFEKEVTNAMKKILKNTSKEGAEKIMADAKKILSQKAKTTTERGLLSQFDLIPSRFDDTTFIVWCQGPRNWHPPYHASFFELGTYKDDANPFLRPATHKYRRRARSVYMKALDKELKTRGGKEYWR